MFLPSRSSHSLDFLFTCRPVSADYRVVSPSRVHPFDLISKGKMCRWKPNHREFTIYNVPRIITGTHLAVMRRIWCWRDNDDCNDDGEVKMKKAQMTLKKETMAGKVMELMKTWFSLVISKWREQWPMMLNWDIMMVIMSATCMYMSSLPCESNWRRIALQETAKKPFFAFERWVHSNYKKTRFIVYSFKMNWSKAPVLDL